MPKSNCDIVVGIPTYNEADTIGFVTKQIDLGLQELNSAASSLIINADNNSPDGTKKAFLGAPTKTPKIYIPSPKGTRGKGINVLNIFKKARLLDAGSVLLFDGDLKSISPQWVIKYVSTLLAGYDFVVPVYSRSKHDGSITNSICYPLLAAFFSANIRQPIGGDYALSGSFVKRLIKKKWRGNALKYGVDIFLTTTALVSNEKIAQVYLGVKRHKLSLPKLGLMYIQVTSTFFELLERDKRFWRHSKFAAPKTFFASKESRPKDFFVDYKYLQAQAYYEFIHYREILNKILPLSLFKNLDKIYARKETIAIAADLWSEILSSMFRAYRAEHNKQDKITIVKAGSPLFFGEQALFIRSTLKSSYKSVEKKIADQAKYFYKNYQKFIKI